MSNELKACPFCGSRNIAKVLQPGLTWVVGCNECGCRTPEYHRSMDAVNVWNTRAQAPEEQECAEELEGGGCPVEISPENVPF